MEDIKVLSTREKALKSFRDQMIEANRFEDEPKEIIRCICRKDDYTWRYFRVSSYKLVDNLQMITLDEFNSLLDQAYKTATLVSFNEDIDVSSYNLETFHLSNNADRLSKGIYMYISQTNNL